MRGDFRIMGVLNVTPDSFSDGGQFLDAGKAVERAQQMIAAGADFVDVGGESTRPGASSVTPGEELARIAPVIKRLMAVIPGGNLSIDSRKDEVFQFALESGVRFFNRVGKLPASDLMRKIANAGGTLAVTHMHGIPETMQEKPLGAAEVKKEVTRFFESCAAEIIAAGFGEGKFWLDPGVGFGKTAAANLEVLGCIQEWSLRWPVMVGLSRKGFLGRIFGIDDPAGRDAPGKTIEWMCAVSGAGLIRTHDVRGLAMLRESTDRVMQGG